MNFYLLNNLVFSDTLPFTPLKHRERERES